MFLKQVLVFLTSLAALTAAATLKKRVRCPSEKAVKHGAAIPSLLDATIEDITSALECGTFTSRDLVNAYLSRIEEVNDDLKAVTEINPEALSIAAGLDAERASGKIRGPLHGIPILVKNNIATADLTGTSAGSTGLIGATVPRDSDTAADLRRAGAIILGKANMSQWSAFRTPNTQNGWSAHGGQCLGPYLPEQDPSGSSSGSAVACAVGLAAACLGTDTGGSIISPAERNNMIGLKPTVGLTSRDLVVPISEHYDTIGPMTRTVRDAALVLAALAGKRANDNYTSAIPWTQTPDYVGACTLDALQGKRVGFPRDGQTMPPGVSGMSFDVVASTLRDAGASVIDEASLTVEELIRAFPEDTWINVLCADFFTNVRSYLGQLSANPFNLRSVADIRAYTTGPNAPESERYPEIDVLYWDISLSNGLGNDDPPFWPAYQIVQEWGNRFIALLDAFNLDAIAIPSWIAPDYTIGVGSPAITVPIGFFPNDTAIERAGPNNLVHIGPNMPYGISFLGRKWSEETLLGIAFAFEQRTKVRQTRRPIVLPETEIEPER